MPAEYLNLSWLHSTLERPPEYLTKFLLDISQVCVIYASFHKASAVSWPNYTYTLLIPIIIV